MVVDITIMMMIKKRAMHTSSLAQLRLWQLISPALPIGAFAYSQGLEYAVECGWISDEEKAYQWISGIAEHSLATLDLPVMIRIFQAWQSGTPSEIEKWSDFLLASRESKEIQIEDKNIGKALATLLTELEISEAAAWRFSDRTNFPVMFTLAASKWAVSIDDALMGYLWAWCENQVAAAIKVVPLGQTSGQRLLSKLIEQIPEWCESAQQIADEDIGMLCPGLGIASALHETQYSRLFRS